MSYVGGHRVQAARSRDQRGEQIFYPTRLSGITGVVDGAEGGNT